jgi:hypothetical protein
MDSTLNNNEESIEEETRETVISFLKENREEVSEI